jgi:hypothetical protein
MSAATRGAMLWGLIMDDKLLHIKTAMCPYMSEENGGTSAFNGRCAWSDAEGDQVFSEWSVNIAGPDGAFQGPRTITGSSGRFRGIQGGLSIQGQVVGDKGQFTATRRWTYQLP